MSYSCYYYTDADNQPTGLFSAEQLQALLHAGSLSPDTLVWKEGATEWHPYRLMFPPPVSSDAALTSSFSGAPKPYPLKPWYERTGWQVVLFVFVPFVQVPLMWLRRLYTSRTRVWVTVGGCLWFLFILVTPSEVREDSGPRDKEISDNEHRDQKAIHP